MPTGNKNVNFLLPNEIAQESVQECVPGVRVCASVRVSQVCFIHKRFETSVCDV
jgi:hypothetical protein